MNNGEAPPIPPKKRTGIEKERERAPLNERKKMFFTFYIPIVMMYNQLIHASEYTFDDSLIPSLNIPNMVAPPPIPVKKRHRKVKSVVDLTLIIAILL